MFAASGLRRSPRPSTRHSTAMAVSKTPYGSRRRGGVRKSFGATPRLTPTRASAASCAGGKENNFRDGDEGGKPFARWEDEDKCKRNLSASFESEEISIASDDYSYPPSESASGSYQPDSYSDGTLTVLLMGKEVGIDASTQTHDPSVPTEVEVKIEQDAEEDGVAGGLNGNALGVEFQAEGASSDAAASVSSDEKSGGLGGSFEHVEGTPFIPDKVKVEGNDSSSLQSEEEAGKATSVNPELLEQLHEYQNLYANASSESSAKDAIIKQVTGERDEAKETVKDMTEKLGSQNIELDAYKAKNEVLSAQLNMASVTAKKLERILDERNAKLAECESQKENLQLQVNTANAKLDTERKHGSAREKAWTDKLDQSNSERDECKAENAALKSEVDDANAKLDMERIEARAKERVSEATLAAFKSENENIMSQFNACNTRYKRCVDEMNQMAAANGKLEGDLQKARAVICVLVAVLLWVLALYLTPGGVLATFVSSLIGIVAVAVIVFLLYSA